MGKSCKSLIQTKSPKLLCVCAVRLGWTPARDVSSAHVSATGSSSPRLHQARSLLAGGHAIAAIHQAGLLVVV